MSLVETFRKKTGKVLKCEVCGGNHQQLYGQHIPGKTGEVKACGQCAEEVINENIVDEREICKQCDSTFSRFSPRNTDGKEHKKCLNCRCN